MRRALRRYTMDSRETERLPLHAALSLTTPEGKPVCPLARCTNVGLGGIRVTAAEALIPGARVDIQLVLPSGFVFAHRGRVAWSRQTVHPSLLGSAAGRDDDALFGIAFEHPDPEDLLPIARLFRARDREIERANRIRRVFGRPNRA